MPKLSEAQQAQRRAHILDAAEVCFARAGFHRTTMQDICREANISAGAIYLYFSSKEALIDGIVGRDREEITQQLTRVGAAPDLFNGLEELMRTAVIERPPHKVTLYIEMLSEANRNPQIAKAIAGCESALMQALADMLREAQRDHRISPCIEPETTARLLLVLGDGLFISLARNRDEGTTRVAPGLLQMIGQYLAGPERPIGALPSPVLQPLNIVAE